MLMQAIKTDASTRPVDCPIRGELTMLAAGLDARFLRAGTTLATAVEVIDRVIGGLDAIVAALDPQSAGAAIADMREIAERLIALPERQRDRGERMHSLDAIVRTLNAYVLDLRKALMMLGINGYNIKIAAWGEVHFVSFVDEISTKLAAGEQHLAGFIEHLKSLTHAVAKVRQSDRLLATESSTVLPTVPARLADDAVSLSDHLSSVATLARRVAVIARNVQQKVAILLGALQVGDSTRQRLEHVVSALQMLEALGHADPAVIGHVDRLLAAQIERALSDFERETAAMLTSLAELGPDTEQLLALIAEQDGRGRSAALGRIEKGIGDVERVTTQVGEAESRSQAMVRVIADSAGDLTDQVGGVRRLHLEIQNIATNTRLLCRRHDVIGRAVSVIAIEVDAQARRLGVIAGGVAGEIGKLDGIEAALRATDHGSDRDIGDMLGSALTVVRDACRRTEDVIGTGSNDARELLALLSGVTVELGRELSVGEPLAVAARMLACRTPVVEPTEGAVAALRALLSAIGGLYTMASEREVHARFLLPGMEPGASPPMPDEDDDGLF